MNDVLNGVALDAEIVCDLGEAQARVSSEAPIQLGKKFPPVVRHGGSPLRLAAWILERVFT